MPKIIPTTKPDNSKPVDFIWLGKYIRHKRTSIGIGVVEAAAMCDLSKTAYSNIELGKNSKVETLFKVMNGFGVRLSVINESEDVNWI